MLLLEPYRIGNVKLKNRFVVAPMSLNMANEGMITEQIANIYEKYAKGGAALITVGDIIVDTPLGNNFVNVIAIDDDKYIESLQGLNNNLHKYGAKTVAQLSHAGRRAGYLNKRGYLETTRGKIPVAPSAIANPTPGYVVPNELSIKQIEDIVDKFVQGAKRAISSGFDIIGIHAAHMYLCSQFLSPLSNHRIDEYGGSLRRRTKFVADIISSIKREVGKDHPIVVRMNGLDGPNGNTASEIDEIAIEFERAGADALHVSAGTGNQEMDMNSFPSVTSMYYLDGPFIKLTERIKNVVNIPIIAVNKIRDVDLAEKILENGKADLIASGRNFIADPDYPLKVQSENIEDIRPCLSCCRCLQKLANGDTITCTVNPFFGTDENIMTAEYKKKVVIIGGGPAGMQAAYIAKLKGHDVVLYEKENQLGGQLNEASVPPFKQDLNKFLNYLSNVLIKTDIKLKLGSVVSPDIIAKEKADVIIIAVGGDAIIPKIHGINTDKVVLVSQVLREKVEIGNEVAIIGGGQVGLETAEFLLQKGKKVTIIEMLQNVGRDMQPFIRAQLLNNLNKYGAIILTNTIAETIIESGIIVSRNGEQNSIKADNIILSVGYRGKENFIDSFKGLAPEIYSIGNCVKQGNILDAIHGGFEIGIKI